MIRAPRDLPLEAGRTRAPGAPYLSLRTDIGILIEFPALTCGSFLRRHRV